MDAAHSELPRAARCGWAEPAAYLLPLGTRVRAVFKMDFGEALYIAELRSGVAGHFSYRRVAGRCIAPWPKRHPALAGIPDLKT